MYNWPSGRVRSTFINYFLRHPNYRHVFVPSTSIVPKMDPSLAFVNAGMNQFKDIILGNGRPKHPRVANSQKCLRINDLSLVGQDNYHHTFFEMLGNWSFANYFKQEACEMAWTLLTEVYQLNPDRLYFTYFGGDQLIPQDIETRDIWKSIGIPEARILPFVKENFWQMGPVGPCGPSTEIHYDHRGTKCDPALINKDTGDIVEIWNLVFMQYNRKKNGLLERLPISHVVDTGAGLERLTAVLNQSVSNYDTDLFTPIFDRIHSSTGINQYSGSFTNEMDAAYRTFSDHIRASTIALSDGILPQKNQKIRRVIKRALNLTHLHFLPNIDSEKEMSAFVKENVSTVSEILSTTYPEIGENMKETLEIFNEEIQRFLESQKQPLITSNLSSEYLNARLLTEFPELSKINQEELKRVKNIGLIEGNVAFKWCDSLGINEEAIEELANSLKVKFDKDGMIEEQESHKRTFREETLISQMEDEQKLFIKKIESFLSLYKPEKGGGLFQPGLGELFSKEGSRTKPQIPITIEWVFDQHGEPLEEVDSSLNKNTRSEPEGYWILLNQSPFFPETHISQSDNGQLVLENDDLLSVKRVIQTPSGWLLHYVSEVGEGGFSRKSKVKGAILNNERRFGRGLSHKTLLHLQQWFVQTFGVVRFENEFLTDTNLGMEVTLLKGTLDIDSFEKCQRDLNDTYGIPVVFVEKSSKGNGAYDIVCCCGLETEKVFRRSAEINHLLTQLSDGLKKDGQSDINSKLMLVKKCLADEEIRISIGVRQRAASLIKEVDHLLMKADEKSIIQEAKKELELLVKSEPIIVKVFNSDHEFTSLKKMTRIAEAEGKPILLIISSSDGFIQARCTVPKGMAKEDFNAQGWLTSFSSKLGQMSVSAPKGQDSRLCTVLKRQKFDEFEGKLKLGVDAATHYANQFSTLRGERDEKRNV